MCKVKNCDLPNETEDYCILHCKKDGWNDLKKNELNKKIELFWETLRVKLYSSCQDVNETCLVEGIIFSKYEEALNFNYPININQENKISTCNILFASDRTYVFKNCTFLEKLDLKELDLEKDLTFDKCTFNQEITFHKSCNSLIFINDCDFCSNNIDLSNRTFKSSLFFKDCKNIGKLNLQRSTIQGSASFSRSKFRTVDFERATFETAVAFNESTFYNDLDFKYTIFNSLVYLQDVVIQGKLNLKSTIFKDEVNFLGIKKQDDKKLEPNNIENRETARIIKHSFEKLDNIIEANKFYALEMQKREEELSKEKNWLDLIVFKFHKISSNHSQDWLLSLLWMINLTFVCTSFQFIEALDSHWLFLYSFLSIGLIITSIEGLAYLEIPKDYKGLFCVIFIFLNWISYSLITNDYTMCYASNNFNPFSIMTGKESLTFGTLIYKAIIAYLIYQFIISIRQNTRRK